LQRYKGRKISLPEDIPLEKIKRAIESSNPPACFLFIAYELYLAEECIKKIKDSYIHKELEEFNFDLLRGWETNYNEICQRCLTLPMMSTYRMLLVKEAEKIEESNIDFLKEYLINPSPTSILIFLFNSTSNNKSFKLLKKYGATHYFNPFSEKASGNWIRNRIAQNGYRIKDDAISYLLDQAGNDMIKIENELKKIELGQWDKKEITLEDIQALIGRSQRHSAFDLADAIGRKSIDRALKILYRLIEDGEEPLKILGALHYHFRLLLKLKNLQHKQTSDLAIMKKLNLNKFNYSGIKEQSKFFSLPELIQAFQLFYQTDSHLKRSQVKAHIYLEQLLLNLMASRKAADSIKL
jgi:DNA polymerase-3 subunit delta